MMAQKSKGRVLIVDDKPEYSTGWVGDLRRMGYTVTVQSRDETDSLAAGCDLAAIFLSDQPARNLDCERMRRIREKNPNGQIIGLTKFSIGDLEATRVEKNVAGLVDQIVYLNDVYQEDLVRFFDRRMQARSDLDD